ncbi:hypothetical protein C8R43DRAFT_1019553 [Mycena crocata]|nr:hypothetical protein C8R43DRAFT_1019553 [Mycena crocata]
MSLDTLLLDQLHGDVLSQIFAFTDVYTVLSLSQVNKYCREVATTKQLWLSLIQNLALRCLIDAPPEMTLDTYSTEALISEVKSLIVGPRSWSRGSSIPPSLSRRCVIPVDISDQDGNPSRYIGLLPGGKHFVCKILTDDDSQDLLECWEVATGLCVWTWGITGHQLDHVRFDLSDGGHKPRVYLALSEGHIRLLVLQVNLKTGESQELFRLASEKLVDGYFPTGVCFSNEFLACVYRAENADLTLLVNRHTESFILIDDFGGMRHIAMLPGHIIFLASRKSIRESNQAVVYSIASLARFWRPLAELDLDTRLTEADITPHLILNIPGNDVHDSQHRLDWSRRFFVDEHPLHRGDYRLTVEMEDFVDVMVPVPPQTRAKQLLSRLRRRLKKKKPEMLPVFRSTVCWYHLALPSDSDSHLRCTLTSVFRHNTRFTTISGAGYGVRLRVEWPLDAHGPVVMPQGDAAEDATRLSDVDGAQQVGLSHTGAVFAVYPARAEVLYYM